MKKYNEFINEGKKLYIKDLDPINNGIDSVSDALDPLIGKLIKFTSGGNRIVGKLEDIELDFGEDMDMFNVYLKVKIFKDKTEFMKVDNRSPIEVIKNVNEEFLGGLFNGISKDEDKSSDIARLLEIGYNLEKLYLKQAYGNHNNGEWTGAKFQMPYSNGEKRNITINIQNSKVIIDDKPDKTFGKQGSIGLESDSIGEYEEIMKYYVDELKDTKFDLS